MPDYNAQEVIDLSYKQAFDILEAYQKLPNPDPNLLLALKTLLFYLEDYAFWK